VTVPTPIGQSKRPVLTPLKSASETLARVLSPGDTVVYESTVYPGATEEVCVPLLEDGSGLKMNKDFYVGYSPERINPGDKEHRLPSILKVTSGSTPEAAEYIDAVYKTIITAGTHLATSIKVAEAAKVIENTQRDLNIALMNELAIIFDKLGIDTLNVLEAAGSKWNFLPFRPGLVGGHCIGVDPYYLTYKAQLEGYLPEVILAGRRINDAMGKVVAEKTVKMLIKSGGCVKGATVLVCGLTFKEDCPDLRNSKVIDVIRELQSYGLTVLVHDPIADPAEALQYYGVTLTPWTDLPEVDGLVLAVAHKEYKEMGQEALLAGVASGGAVVDVKSGLDMDEVHAAGFRGWRL